MAFGYDTAGLVEFANDGFNPAKVSDLLDGFYVSTTDNPNGTGTNFVPQLTLNVGFGAFAALNLVVFDAGVGGGINGDVNFTLHDPNTDGKLRFSEIAADFSMGPLCVFDVSGSLSASLDAFVKIGFDTPFGFVGYEDNYTIAQTTLLNFNFGCNSPGNPDPVLASESGNVLRLNVGQNAGNGSTAT